MPDTALHCVFGFVRDKDTLQACMCACTNMRAVASDLVPRTLVASTSDAFRFFPRLVPAIERLHLKGPGDVSKHFMNATAAAAPAKLAKVIVLELDASAACHGVLSKLPWTCPALRRLHVHVGHTSWHWTTVLRELGGLTSLRELRIDGPVTLFHSNRPVDATRLRSLSWLTRIDLPGIELGAAAFVQLLAGLPALEHLEADVCVMNHAESDAYTSGPVVCALTSMHMTTLTHVEVWSLLRLVPSIRALVATDDDEIDIRGLDDPASPGLARNIRRFVDGKYSIASACADAVIRIGDAAVGVLADIIDAAAPLIGAARFPGGVVLSDRRVDAAAVRALGAAGVTTVQMLMCELDDEAWAAMHASGITDAGAGVAEGGSNLSAWP